MMTRAEEIRNKANGYAFDLDEGDLNTNRDTFIDGAMWADEHPQQLWKDAQGDNLPEIEREVIVLCQHYPLKGNEYTVAFAHRPPESYTGVSIVNHSEMEEYYPERYGKGGWNIPDVVWWLDLDFPIKQE